MSDFKTMAIRGVAALVFASTAIAAPVALTANPANATQSAVVNAAAKPGDGTADGAIAWFKKYNGSTKWEHYCEKAVENAYGTSGVWASANAHWNGASKKHPGDKKAPKGAFVYWDTGKYGHVGISDGDGGIYATSVGDKIGHVTKAKGGVDYFVKKWNAKYRGWTPAARPVR